MWITCALRRAEIPIDCRRPTRRHWAAYFPAAGTAGAAPGATGSGRGAVARAGPGRVDGAGGRGYGRGSVGASGSKCSRQMWMGRRIVGAGLRELVLRRRLHPAQAPLRRPARVTKGSEASRYGRRALFRGGSKIVCLLRHEAVTLRAPKRTVFPALYNFVRRSARRLSGTWMVPDTKGLM